MADVSQKRFFKPTIQPRLDPGEPLIPLSRGVNDASGVMIGYNTIKHYKRSDTPAYIRLEEGELLRTQRPVILAPL